MTTSTTTATSIFHLSSLIPDLITFATSLTSEKYEQLKKDLENENEKRIIQKEEYTSTRKKRRHDEENSRQRTKHKRRSRSRSMSPSSHQKNTSSASSKPIAPVSTSTTSAATITSVAAGPSDYALTNQWGKYGTIDASDMYTKQNEFECWLQEIKGVSRHSLTKREIKDKFDEYMEDYNTATLPAPKYYNLDEKSLLANDSYDNRPVPTMFNDEEVFKQQQIQERQQIRKAQQQEVVNRLREEKAKSREEYDSKVQSLYAQPKSTFESIAKEREEKKREQERKRKRKWV
jgi:hypothetical protein